MLLLTSDLHTKILETRTRVVLVEDLKEPCVEDNRDVVRKASLSADGETLFVAYDYGDHGLHVPHRNFCEGVPLLSREGGCVDVWMNHKVIRPYDMRTGHLRNDWERIMNSMYSRQWTTGNLKEMREAVERCAEENGDPAQEPQPQPQSHIHEEVISGEDEDAISQGEGYLQSLD